MNKDEQEPVAPKEATITSDKIPNAHASGDGSLERSETELPKSEEASSPSAPETLY
ncbi:MAG: hypothetical protein JWP88_1390 [Flaviaesturariibacter sp.]|nr:hypothetical protein [Flaviaesturariibacter sp.]